MTKIQCPLLMQPFLLPLTGGGKTQAAPSCLIRVRTAWEVASATTRRPHGMLGGGGISVRLPKGHGSSQSPAATACDSSSETLVAGAAGFVLDGLDVDEARGPWSEPVGAARGLRRCLACHIEVEHGSPGQV